MPGGAAARFDQWIGEAEIASGAVTLSHNEVTVNGRKQTLNGTVTFGTPPKVKLASVKVK
jgi:hypothetical protein